ncbi:MAG: D-sedoheptulose 7-phosphate isomerase [Candidatus Margulisbacteria bacterium]|nr:D-sedoheptulose 7-phosphate isomerase [Candidatus Margulisiibacteriota bacterium]
MRENIKSRLKESIAVKNKVLEELVPQIETAARQIVAVLKNGNKVLLFGNGGSASDAQHLAGELIGRFKKNRRALAAIALNTDTSILTCLSNDFGYDTVFERQIEGLAKAGDICIGLSTSGNSENVLRGLRKAKELGCKTIAFLGCDGGKIAREADLTIIIPSQNTPRIQESHITIGHIICGLVEEELFTR